MSKTKVGLEVDIDTSQAKKGLQELSKTEVKTPVHIDTKDAKKEIQELSKTKVEIDLNFDPKKVKKSVEGATGDAFKRYQPRSKAAGGKMPAISGGGGGSSLTGILAMGLGLWNNANQSVKAFETQIRSVTRSLEPFQEQSAKLHKEMEDLIASGKAYTGKTQTVYFKGENGRGSYTREVPIETDYFKGLQQRRANLANVIGEKEEQLKNLEFDYNLAKESRFAELKGFGDKITDFGKAQIGKLPGGELLLKGGSSLNGALLSKIGIGGGSLLLGAGAAIGASKMWYDAAKGKIDEGQGAQRQIESINASLGTISKNFTGISNVSALTDQLMLMGVQGVNSVENLSAAASTLMLAFEGNQSAVSEWLPYIDDMAAATGMSAEQMASLIAQSAEMEMVDSRLFSSISRQGIPIYDKLAEVLGVTTDKAKEMAKQGKISAQQFQEAFKNVAETVKGTSEALSSMTLEGAEASFKASGELEHAGFARGYNLSRIEYLKQLTEEQLKNAEDAIYQINSEGTGAAVAAIDNMWQSVAEWFDGVVEHILMLPANLFGYTAEARSLSHKGAASSLKEKALAIDELIKKNPTKDELESAIKALAEEANKIDELLHPDWDKIIRESGGGYRASQAIAEHPRSSMSQEDVDRLESVLMLAIDRINDAREYSSTAKTYEEVKAEKEAEKEEARRQANREEWLTKQIEADWEKTKNEMSSELLEVAFNNLLTTQGYDSIPDAQNRLAELDRAYKSGVITDKEKNERDKIISLIEDWDSAFTAVVDRETKAREESAAAIEKETKAREAAVMEEKKQWAQLAQMFGDPNGVRELKELEMQERLAKMEHIDEPMKEYFMEKWIEDQETRDYRKYAIAMGKNKYKGEEMLQDEIDDINKLTYLTQDERDQMIEAARARLMEEMQSTTEEGTLLGVNTLTGEKIYGTADAMMPKNKDEYIHNAWGAACRVITQFDTNWDQKQYDELQKSTKANVETAKGIQELNKKAIGPVVQ